MMIYSIMSHQMKSKDYYCFDAMRATEMQKKGAEKGRLVIKGRICCLITVSINGACCPFIFYLCTWGQSKSTTFSTVPPQYNTLSTFTVYSTYFNFVSQFIVSVSPSLLALVHQFDNCSDVVFNLISYSLELRCYRLHINTACSLRDSLNVRP